MSVHQEKSPSAFGVYFYAVLMALLGATLGFFYMTGFPAQAFSSEKEYQASLANPDEPTVGSKPGDAYYLEGPVLRTRAWEAKRQQLATPGAQTVQLTPGEINAWMTAKFRPGTTPTDGEEPDVLIVPGVPNVAISQAGTLYLNLPTTITAYGSMRDFTVSARAAIDATGLKFESVRVSSALVPLPQVLGRKILETLAKGYQTTEEYQILSDAFARAESIDAVGGELVIQMR